MERKLEMTAQITARCNLCSTVETYKAGSKPRYDWRMVSTVVDLSGTYSPYCFCSENCESRYMEVKAVLENEKKRG